jgi:hypothetical protein
VRHRACRVRGEHFIERLDGSAEFKRVKLGNRQIERRGHLRTARRGKVNGAKLGGGARRMWMLRLGGEQWNDEKNSDSCAGCALHMGSGVRALERRALRLGCCNFQGRGAYSKLFRTMTVKTIGTADQQLLSMEPASMIRS